MNVISSIYEHVPLKMAFLSKINSPYGEKMGQTVVIILLSAIRSGALCSFGLPPVHHHQRHHVYTCLTADEKVCVFREQVSGAGQAGMLHVLFCPRGQGDDKGKSERSG